MKKEKKTLIIQNQIEEEQPDENEEVDLKTNDETNQNEIKGDIHYFTNIFKYNKDDKDNVFKAWSCCMNTDEKSKGCDCKMIKKLKTKASIIDAPDF